MAYEFAPPVTEAQLARLDGRPQIVQFGSALTEDDYLLSLEGHTKDVDVVGGLTSLVDLTLRSMPVSDLDFSEQLDELRALDLKLGAPQNSARWGDSGGCSARL